MNIIKNVSVFYFLYFNDFLFLIFRFWLVLVVDLERRRFNNYLFVDFMRLKNYLCLGRIYLLMTTNENRVLNKLLRLLFLFLFKNGTILILFVFVLLIIPLGLIMIISWLFFDILYFPFSVYINSLLKYFSFYERLIIFLWSDWLALHFLGWLAFDLESTYKVICFRVKNKLLVVSFLEA